MNIASIVQSYKLGRRMQKWSRQRMLSFQRQRLEDLLTHTYQNSSFYRELWESKDINQSNLLTTPLENFPIVNKQMLMENFEQAITEKDITKAEVEKFIASDPSGKELYKNKYLALNTSGSSGRVGIFLFTDKFLTLLNGSIIARMIHPLWPYLLHQTKVAFIGEASGHHSGYSLVQHLPAYLFKTLSIDVDSSAEVFAKALNEFQPKMIIGYPSGIAVLGETQKAGKLSIKPNLIICSGEPLTEVRRESISTGLGVQPIDFYACTECLALGTDTKGKGKLELFDDLTVLEVVDDKNHKVKLGENGRVVITVLENFIQPLIRYELDDEIALLPDDASSPFTQAETVSGRSLEILEFETPKGKLKVHPMDMVGLFFPGMAQYQVEQTGPKDAVLRIVADDEVGVKKYIDENLPEYFASIGLDPADVTVTVQLVKDIPLNPKTGKTPIIIPLKK